MAVYPQDKTAKKEETRILTEHNFLAKPPKINESHHHPRAKQKSICQNSFLQLTVFFNRSAIQIPKQTSSCEVRVRHLPIAKPDCLHTSESQHQLEKGRVSVYLFRANQSSGENQSADVSSHQWSPIPLKLHLGKVRECETYFPPRKTVLLALQCSTVAVHCVRRGFARG